MFLRYDQVICAGAPLGVPCLVPKGQAVRRRGLQMANNDKRGESMDFGAILSRLFVIAIIAIIYYIILKALVLMGKDLKKTGTEQKEPLMTIEVLDPGENKNLKRGAMIPVRNGVTFGRQNDNTVVLNDPYVSSYHVRFFRNERRSMFTLAQQIPLNVKMCNDNC